MQWVVGEGWEEAHWLEFGAMNSGGNERIIISSEMILDWWFLKVINESMMIVN